MKINNKVNTFLCIIINLYTYLYRRFQIGVTYNLYIMHIIYKLYDKYIYNII